MQQKNVFTTGDTGITERVQLYDKQKFNRITDLIFQSALKIHKYLGPGLLEKSYKECLFYDLIQNHNLKVEREKFLPISFEKLYIPDAYRIDLLVEDSIVLEIKSIRQLTPLDHAQLLSYLKLGNYRIGYLINFNQPLIKDGIKRLAL
ncbi:MAG: GxxExxY protein [Micavibrio aeruginosavorus]|uniref:GxxExxY protein n=1 Tax=Micavibrio aeruginosavorus TaxID=349221 RepID=A0A2W5FJ56_9BACT|nr:MAG: GxxExxY protein [Micavibrio aeruginosavorus]